MIDRVKLWVKQKNCSHERQNLKRWHWVRKWPELSEIEAEYKCEICDKSIYYNFTGCEARMFDPESDIYKQIIREPRWAE